MPEPLPIMVGRSGERALAQRHLAAALDGRGSLLLIGGEAGIGKTTLVRDLARQAESAGMLVLTGSCYDLSATPPYGPWVDLALRIPRAPGRPSPPVSLVAGEIEGVANQAALFAQVRSFLSSLYPALVILEDLHWADPASLELLRYVATPIATQQLCVAVTYRSDELTRHHPLYRQLPSLVGAAGGERLDLHPLSPSDFRDLAAARYQLPTPDEDRLVDYLARHAEGNPFFGEELLRTLEEEGRLSRSGERWRFAQTDEIIVPPLLRQIVDGRASRLGDDTRRALEVAAIIGQEVPIELWRGLLDLDESAAFDIVERAADATIICEQYDGTRMQFVHALTRSALYEGVMPPRRRNWHRLIGERISSSPRPDPDAVAYHLRQAGDPRAWEWLERAGERAQRAYAWLTAVDRFAAAARLLEDVADAEADRSRLLYRCGRLLRYSDPRAGVAHLEDAERLARSMGNRVLEAESRYSRGLLWAYADRFRIGNDEMEAGVSILESLPETEARASWVSGPWLADSVPRLERAGEPEIDPSASALMALGINHRRGGLPWFLAAAGHLDEAEAMANRFLTAVDGVPAGGLTTSATGHSLQALGIINAARGKLAESRAAFGQARAIYDQLDHHAVIAFTYLCELREAVLPFMATNPAECRRLAAEAEEAIRRAGDAFPVGMSKHIAWIGIMVVTGVWDEAIEVAASVSDYGNYCLRQQVAANMAYLAKWRGKPDDAWAAIHETFPEGPDTEPGDRVLHECLQLQRLAVDLLLDAGDLPGALAWLEANDRWLEWSGALLGRAENRAFWARYELALGNLRRARAYADEAIACASAPMQALALIPAHRTAGEIARRDERFADAEQSFLQALDIADRSEAAYGRALTMHSLAQLYAETRRLDDARRLLAQSREVLEKLQAAPALAATDRLNEQLDRHGAATPMGLTTREVEVLRLVARGMTDAEVAEELSISPRTVGQHLRSVYNKLDVSSRTAATRIAIDQGIV